MEPNHDQPEPIDPKRKQADGSARSAVDRTARRFDSWDAVVVGFLLSAMIGAVVGIVLLLVLERFLGFDAHRWKELPLLTAGIAGLAGAVATVRWKYCSTKHLIQREGRSCLCGYSFRGLHSAVCPECGTPREKNS